MTSDYPPIWFLRHGQTEWNLVRRIQGGLDSPLTGLGRQQAARQQKIMAPLIGEILAQGARIYVSPLGRAQDTARIALPDQSVVTDPRLAEINTGDWEGQMKDRVASGGPDLDIYTAAPNGEGFDGLSARVQGFLDDLESPAVIVSHGMLGQVMRGLVRGLTRDQMAALSNGQGCVYRLRDGQEDCLAL